jgi:hypothetical protein
MNRKEQELQNAICKYMRLQYPNVIFKVDGGADANKVSYVARQVYSKQQYKRGYPDFQIIKPSKHYNGLFLELKSCYSELFNKNGTMRRGSNDHHVEQYDFIKELRDNGYYADFAWDLDNSLNKIIQYLDNGLLFINEYHFNSLTIAERKELEADKFFNGL